MESYYSILDLLTNVGYEKLSLLTFIDEVNYHREYKGTNNRKGLSTRKNGSFFKSYKGYFYSSRIYVIYDIFHFPCFNLKVKMENLKKHLMAYVNIHKVVHIRLIRWW